MNNYKDFIIKTLIVTFAVLIVIFFLLSPINKALRVADKMLQKIETPTTKRYKILSYQPMVGLSVKIVS